MPPPSAGSVRGRPGAVSCRRLSLAVLLSSSAPTGLARAMPDDAAESLVVSAAVPPVSALSPDAMQPASTLTTAFIRAVAPPTASYDEIVRLSPSVVSIGPDGPGLSENAVLTIRGFADGQYNVTFDGIPFGDTDDFTHHSTAYFASQALREVSVERGPGTASTLGEATFGGTVSLRSIDPLATPALSASATAASFDTRRVGARLDTGTLAALHDLALVVETEHTASDGALENSGSERSTLFVKAVLPVGQRLLLTVVGTAALLRQRQPAGATLAQIAAFGPGYALGDGLAQQNAAAFNGESYHTDFAYAALHWDNSGGLSVDERVYTYGLYRHFANGEDVDGETPNGTVFGAGDVPGQLGRNDLRAWGDVLRLEQAWPGVRLRLGIWAEHQHNDRSQYQVDLPQGGRPDPVLAAVPGVAGSAAIDRLQHDTLDTLQPFLELEWRPLPGLTLLPGFKWSQAVRQVDAPVMEGTRLPTVERAAYDALLPSVAARQRLSRSWSVYAQAAEGSLAPPLQLLDTTTAAANVAPERTWNLQLGSTWQRPGWSAGLDGYLIQFDDLLGTRTVGDETVAFDQGGATYAGLEAETTLALGWGFSLYANASLNRARDHDTGAPVPNSPQATLAGGLLYRAQGWFGSATDKWVGARYGDVDRQAGLDPFNQLDLALGRVLQPVDGRPALRLELQLQNLLDDRRIDALAGYTVAQSTPLWFTQPGRSLWMTATLSL